jgi:hypothetical protein
MEVRALLTQVPGKDPNSQQQDHQQGHGQRCRLAVNSAAQ